MPDIEIQPLELSEFRYADPALVRRRGVVMGYVVRHPDGVLLFDTGFGFGNAELDDMYAPVGRPILEILREAGVEMDEITEVVNCHLHVDHAGQNGAFPGARIHVQSAEWELAHSTAGEWVGDPGALEGRSSAPDPLAYDRSIERLRELDPVRVHFSHDRAIWTAEPERPYIVAGGAG